jgi:hypothetical protein
VLIDKVDVTDNIVRRLSTSIVAGNHGNTVVDGYYEGKNITVHGSIVQDTYAAMLVARDSLFTAANILNATLKHNNGVSVLQYTGSLKNPMFTETQGGFARFTLEYQTTQPYGIDTNLKTILSATGETTATVTGSLSTIAGNFENDPIISVYINSVTDGDGYISLTNPATGRSIKISRTFAAGELLVVDGTTMTVKVNNVEVDFTGKFLTYDPGANQQITYLDDFTARNVNIKVQVYPRFI